MNKTLALRVYVIFSCLVLLGVIFCDVSLMLQGYPKNLPPKIMLILLTLGGAANCYTSIMWLKEKDYNVFVDDMASMDRPE